MKEDADRLNLWRYLLAMFCLASFLFVEAQILHIYEILERVAPTVEEPSPVHTRATR